METSFQKVQKGTSQYIPMAHWSNKTFALFYTQEENYIVLQVKHHTLFNIF